jgi:hypothetical protein
MQGNNLDRSSADSQNRVAALLKNVGRALRLITNEKEE